MSYASGTNVSEERSRAEIQRILGRFDADQFGFMTDRSTGFAKLMFRYKAASFIFELPLATRDDDKLRFTPRGKRRTDRQAGELAAVENRRRWRSLCLAIKAMLVGVEDGIFQFGEVFMPYMVWGDGRTTAQTLLPAVEQALQAGRGLPPLQTVGKLLESKS